MMPDQPDDFTMPPEAPYWLCPECGRREAAGLFNRGTVTAHQTRKPCRKCGSPDMTARGDWPQ